MGVRTHSTQDTVRTHSTQDTQANPQAGNMKLTQAHYRSAQASGKHQQDKAQTLTFMDPTQSSSPTHSSAGTASLQRELGQGPGPSAAGKKGRSIEDVPPASRIPGPTTEPSSGPHNGVSPKKLSGAEQLPARSSPVPG